MGNESDYTSFQPVTGTFFEGGVETPNVCFSRQNVGFANIKQNFNYS
jgi:hypothetical protein